MTSRHQRTHGFRLSLFDRKQVSWRGVDFYDPRRPTRGTGCRLGEWLLPPEGWISAGSAHADPGVLTHYILHRSNAR